MSEPKHLTPLQIVLYAMFTIGTLIVIAFYETGIQLNEMLVLVGDVLGFLTDNPFVAATIAMGFASLVALVKPFPGLPTRKRAVLAGMTSIVVFSLLLTAEIREAQEARRARDVAEQGRLESAASAAHEASGLVAERDFPTRQEGIEQRLDTIDSLIDGEAWVNALKNGEALQQELLPLFRSSLADAPEVVSIRTRLDDALRIARREENVLRRAEERSQRLRVSIGTSNRNVQRVSIAELQGERLFVQWAINDNLTAGMIRGGARLDIRNMLEVIADSQEPYTSVFLRGTFALGRLLKNSVKWDRQIDPGVLPCSQHR